MHDNGLRTLSEKAWAQAKRRAAIIIPLADQGSVSHSEAEKAAQKLGIGIGDEVGCVQFLRVDGELSYLMATDGIEYRGEPGTPTPVDGKFCLPMTKVVDIAGFFVETGRKPIQTAWEEI